MWSFNTAAGATVFSAWGIWILVLAALFGFNEISRRFKWFGFFSFFILPVVLTLVWFFVMPEATYTDWFHLAKVYSVTAACIIFWLIRFVQKKDAAGKVLWRLADKKWVLTLPAIILAVNILEAVSRDFQVGMMYFGTNSGPIEGEVTGVLGGSWNFMNGIAGILNIITITGWFGIVIRKEIPQDKSRDMLWPDMLWFWILAYDLWNFTYVYNCLPTHSWYAGFALLLAATLAAFTIGKGAWLQHRAATLAIWCMFAQTFPNFLDQGATMVVSTYNKAIYTFWGALSLASNVAVFIYMIYKVIKTRRNPYLGELYTDLTAYKAIKELAE